MTTKTKQFEPLLFSTVGVAAMFLILVAVYVISGVVKHRFDFTQEKLYTLSPGTKAILEKLDTPVEVRFYCTQDSKEMPVMLKTYAQRVEDLIGELRKVAGNKIEIKKFDPKPDTDAEDSARLDGLEGQMVSLNDKIYLGLAISQLDAKVAIPFLSPEREKLLEYDIARAISRVTTTSKPVVGVMSSLPVMGEFNPMMMRMGQMQRQEPWVFVSELKRDFEVKQVEMTVEEIPSDIKVLIVAHPKGITDKTQYAIDQFVLKGGKLVAFLDPLSLVDSRNMPGMNPLQAASQSGSTLDKLVKAWGLEFDQNKVVADMSFITRINRGGRAESAPAFLTMTQEGMNSEDVITSQIDSAWIPFSGAFTGTPIEGLKQTVLLKSTKASQLVERFMADFSGDQTVKDFSASGKEFAMAVRLNGKFKTAFPDGKPKDAAADKPEEKKEGEKKDEKPADSSLKESASEGVVILVGDADMLFDQFSVQVQEFFGQRIVIPRNGNLNLVQNIVEQLAGDSNLISVRSRATMNRPFTLVRQMQAQAEERYRSKIKDLEKSLSDTQTRLNELQRNRGDKESGQRFILSPEQQQEIQKFQTKQAEVNRELRKERRNLRRDIDSLENRLKWLNIAGMPLLVAISGISLALLKQKRTAAK
ncbi:MAG: Gldg family protein [Verrucomicrobia bacterium]|nr:Gldg family protein [Verrucomicrobiota bacterium]